MGQRQSHTVTILKNGRVTLRMSAKVDLISPAFGLGQSLFETMLVRDQPKLGSVFLVEEHIARLVGSANRLGWTGLPDEKTLVRWVARAARLFGEHHTGYGRLRLTAAWTKGDGPPDVYVTVFPYKMPQHAATVVTTPVKLPWSDSRGAHKAGSRHVYELAQQFALPQNADEALLVDDQGRPAEGARSNLFLVEDGVVLTAPVKSGVLPGITRMAVLRLAAQIGLQPQEEPFTHQRMVDGVGRGDVFLTNALWGVRPVAAIDEHQTTGLSPVVKKIRKAYQKAVSNGFLAPGKPIG